MCLKKTITARIGKTWPSKDIINHTEILTYRKAKATILPSPIYISATVRLHHLDTNEGPRK